MHMEKYSDGVGMKRAVMAKCLECITRVQGAEGDNHGFKSQKIYRGENRKRI